MAKRGPQSSLNHLNWNETDEPEEKGEFAKASDDVLKLRVIKKARRRVATDAADSTAPGAAPSASVFGSFKGFASTPLAKGGGTDKPDGAPSFSFLSTLGGAAKTNGNGTATVSSSGADSGVAGSTKPMFSFGTNQGTIGAADAGKKMFTFGTPNALKADSTEGGKNASSTSSGFGISSSKDSEKDGTGKGLFSFGGATAANPATAGPTPTFSFGTVPTKSTTDSSKPEKGFTFGIVGGNKDKSSDTTPKGTFLFGSAAAKTDTGETEKKTIAFGAKDSSLSAASSTGMFNFGSNAAKTDTNDAEKKTFGLGSSPAATKSTFAFGSPATKTDYSETERKGFTFGSSPVASKEPPKGIFSFGSPATKPATAADTSDKATVTFGSPAGTKDTPTTTPKGTFSFGSVAPKADEASDKKATTFSFGSIASSGTQGSPKSTFSFGSVQPGKNDAIGFGAAASSPAKKPSEPEKKTFSFGIPPASSVPVDKSKASFGAPKENSEDTLKKMFSFAPSTTAPAPKVVDSGKKDEEKKSMSFSHTTTTTTNPTPTTTQSTSMKKNVIALNHAFVAWITQKCKENAYCNFSPVFKSYETYFAKFKELEQNGTEQSVSNSTESGAATKLTLPSSQPSKTEGFPGIPTAKPGLEPKPIDPIAKEPEKTKEKTGFFFGTSAPKELPTAKTLAPASGGFTFGSGKPLTFGGFSSTNAAPSTASTTTNNASTVSTSSPSFFAGASTFASKSLTPGGFTFGSGIVKPPVPDSSAAGVNKDTAGGEDADDDEPPKVEFTPVEEKDSVYSKRCKLYFKVDSSYSDRGVCTLHIKKVDGKVQLLVRADTALGNILLNIILNESVPLQRVGKNNVMLICLPLPDSKPPPTSVLLRVKTEAEANDLMETLMKYKPK
ncbi:nuclear pore complex protein Nup50 [Anopheles maculipalpis]|uniref:nuclear pore complex protein Nup50 n=1 Tax=Anopheles maculipalpis TaxID=1496333 RepID=UPI002159974A|nr:nuclear pore complex protein Nup50 [Anopheles maculipalpis]